MCAMEGERSWEGSHHLLQRSWVGDEFMSMYGYQGDLVKVPNFHSRSTWNYVKTSNACMRGSVPSEDMAAINSILDSGITFWHTGAVGNYSANNSII